jgi:hypothetical protein
MAENSQKSTVISPTILLVLQFLLSDSPIPTSVPTVSPLGLTGAYLIFISHSIQSQNIFCLLKKIKKLANTLNKLFDTKKKENPKQIPTMDLAMLLRIFSLNAAVVDTKISWAPKSEFSIGNEERSKRKRQCFCKQTGSAAPAPAFKIPRTCTCMKMIKRFRKLLGWFIICWFSLSFTSVHASNNNLYPPDSFATSKHMIFQENAPVYNNGLNTQDLFHTCQLTTKETWLVFFISGSRYPAVKVCRTKDGVNLIDDDNPIECSAKQTLEETVASTYATCASLVSGGVAVLWNVKAGENTDYEGNLLFHVCDTPVDQPRSLALTCGPKKTVSLTYGFYNPYIVAVTGNRFVTAFRHCTNDWGWCTSFNFGVVTCHVSDSITLTIACGSVITKDNDWPVGRLVRVFL